MQRMTHANGASWPFHSYGSIIYRRYTQKALVYKLIGDLRGLKVCQNVLVGYIIK